jgi:hypothetical protein
MICYPFAPETPQNHANQEFQVFVFIFVTPMNPPRPSRVCISKKSQVAEKYHLTEARRATLVGVPRSNSGAGHRL